MVKETIRKIEEQQKKYDEFTPQYQVGEQLKDICRRSPEQADLRNLQINTRRMVRLACRRGLQRIFLLNSTDSEQYQKRQKRQDRIL